MHFINLILKKQDPRICSTLAGLELRSHHDLHQQNFGKRKAAARPAAGRQLWARQRAPRPPRPAPQRGPAGTRREIVGYSQLCLSSSSTFGIRLMGLVLAGHSEGQGPGGEKGGVTRRTGGRPGALRRRAAGHRGGPVRPRRGRWQPSKTKGTKAFRLLLLQQSAASRLPSPRAVDRCCCDRPSYDR